MSGAIVSSSEVQTAVAWLERARAEEDRDEPEAALEAVERALALDPEEGEAWRMKASLLLDLERPEEAERTLAEATERLPEDAGCWFDRGAALVVRGEHHAAAECFERALERGHPRAAANLGRARLEAQEFGPALEALDRAVKEFPSEAALWARRGEAALGALQPQEALESFDKALDLAPDDYVSLGNRGLALARLSRPEPALESLERALALAPADARLWGNKGLVLEQLMREEEAVAAFDRALELDPNDPESWEHKAQHLMARGEPEQAAECRRRALRLQGRLKAWGLCLVDENSQAVPGSELGVESDMPPDGIAVQFLQMLARQGRQVGQDGVVDGKYRVAMWELPPGSVQA